MAGKLLVPASFLFLLFAAVGLFAPIWHDEAIIFMEFAGYYVSADHITAASTLKASILHAHPGIVQLLGNIAHLGFQITPPLFYILLWIWRHVAGDSLIAMRVLSLLYWIAMLVVFRLWSGSPFAVALLMLNSFGIQVATLARPYGLAVLWIMLAAYLLDSERKSAKWTTTAGYLSALLAVWTHYVAVVPVAMIVGWHIVHVWHLEKKRYIRRAAIAALAALPCGYLAWRQLRPTPLPFTGLIREVNSITRDLLRLPLNPLLNAGRVVDLAVSLLFLAVLLVSAATFRSQSGKVRLSLLVICGQTAALILAGGLLQSHLAADRYLGLTLPFCCFVIADSFHRRGSTARYWQIPVLAIVVFCAIADAVLSVERIRTQREGLRDPAEQPMLLIGNISSGSDIMAVMLHDMSDRSDFIALPQDQDMAAFAPDLERYKEAWICPSYQPPRPHERELEDRTRDAEIRLFREYSCYRVLPKRTRN